MIGEASAGGYKVKDLDGTTDVTAAVAGPGYTLAPMAPGATRELAVEVKVTKNATPGSQFDNDISTYSTTLNDRGDTVSVVTKRK